jgi:hypothetical protein
MAAKLPEKFQELALSKFLKFKFAEEAELCTFFGPLVLPARSRTLRKAQTLRHSPGMSPHGTFSVLI